LSEFDAEIRRGRLLLYVFCSFDESYAAHDMVAVFDSEYLPDFFWDSYSSACDDFCEERNVFFLDLYWQLLASGQMAKNQ
jgi:hypothetical protein